MSLKENIEAVKQEIGTEEQFLEGLIKSERFFKRYKKYIISLGIVLIVGGVSYSVTNMIKADNLQVSNEAYSKLLLNNKDTKSLKILKNKNERLYNLYRLQIAVKANDITALKEILKTDNDQVISDLATYQLASLENTKIENSKLLRGFNLLRNGYNLIIKGKIEEAKLEFAQIDLNSPLKNVAKNLEHYQGKKILDNK